MTQLYDLPLLDLCYIKNFQIIQLIFICSKSTLETLEKVVLSVMQEGEINLFSESSQWEHLSGFQMIIGSRSSHQSSSITKGVFRNFPKFTGKHLWQSLFLIRLQASGFRPGTLLKKETLVQVLSCESCEIAKNTFFKEHLRTTASVN